jgi:hypothetical protein
MATNKRTPGQVEHDQAEIAQRYLRGETQSQIARALDVCQQQVSYDLKKIQERWRESAVRDFDQHKAEQLARIDALEREYWAGWERSKKPIEHTHQQKSEDDIELRAGHAGRGRIPAHRTRLKATKSVQEQVGNSAFLYGVQNCIAERSKLLGLYPATDINLQGSLSFGDLWQIAQQDSTPDIRLLPPHEDSPSA